MEERFLPIGTIVKLKGSKKRLMITGFLPVEDNKEETTEVWDYSGCLYPEGIISSTNNLLFNHSSIEEVQFKGLVDEEERQFKEKMKETIEEINKKIS